MTEDEAAAASKPRRKAPYRIAAACLALISTLVAWGIYSASAPSSNEQMACIRKGGSGVSLPAECHHSMWIMVLIAAIIVAGWGGAARVWRRE